MPVVHASRERRGILEALMELEGKRVVVVGMAASGIAAAHFLRERKARVVVSEMRPAVELRREIAELLETGVVI